MSTSCPQCGRRLPTPRPAEPSRTWVEKARANSMHSFTAAEEEALGRLARTLREIRARSGLTRVELARATGLSTSYLKQLEGGVRRPRFETLQRVARGLQPPPPTLAPNGTMVNRGQAGYRSEWQADEDRAANDVLLELLTAAEGAIAPSVYNRSQPRT